MSLYLTGERFKVHAIYYVNKVLLNIFLLNLHHITIFFIS